MSMGFTFTSFDSAAAAALTSGSLPADVAGRVRAALLWDPYRAETEEEQKRAATLAERFCSAGLAATYSQCAPADLPLLDGLFAGLFADEAGLAELRTRGHIDPWGWKALAAFISKELSQSMHAYRPSAQDWTRGWGPFAEWEVDAFQSAMTSLAEGAKEGRSVLAHYG